MNAIEAIEEFLEAYIGMSLRPSPPDCYVIEGRFPVVAQFREDISTLVNKVFCLKIVVPVNYPDALPIVYEIENGAQIPTSPDYHKNSDSSLCLGSPLALFVQLSRSASLVSFAESCIVPHLASAVLKKERGMPFQQGELKHSGEGLEENIAEYFGINIPLKLVPPTFELLGEKKGKANKQPCPCSKGPKLGACSCSIHRFISSERKKKRHSRRFFRNVAKYYAFYVARYKENPLQNKKFGFGQKCVH